MPRLPSYRLQWSAESGKSSKKGKEPHQHHTSPKSQHTALKAPLLNEHSSPFQTGVGTGLDDTSKPQDAPWDNLIVLRRNIPSVPKRLIHLPTILVDHYFDSVCNIFSAFDGPSNPFRSAVEALWNGWEPIYYTIQSMAAAYLANDIPRIVGLQL